MDDDDDDDMIMMFCHRYQNWFLLSTWIVGFLRFYEMTTDIMIKRLKALT